MYALVDPILHPGGPRQTCPGPRIPRPPRLCVQPQGL